MEPRWHRAPHFPGRPLICPFAVRHDYLEDSGTFLLSTVESVKVIAEEVLGRFQTVDFLVNNTAIRPRKPFPELDDDERQKVIDLDLTSALITVRAHLPGTVARLGVGDQHCRHDGHSRLCGRGADFRCQAWPLGPDQSALHGIRRPWHHRQRRLSRLDSGGRALRQRPKHLAGIPAGVMAEPEGIAAVVCFLASPAGRFVTGQMINASGGGAT